MNKNSSVFKNLANKVVSKAYDLPKSFASALADKVNKDPNFEKKLNSVLSFRIVDPKNKKTIQNFFDSAGSYSGFGAGSLGGASLDADSLGERLNNTLLGGVAGAFGGSRAGRAFGAVAPSLAQKSFGRVATNLYMPFGYDINLAKDIAQETLKGNKKVNPLVNMLRSVIKDEPLYAVEPETLGREFLYRKMYGLKPRFGAQSYFIPAGKNKHWTYNLDNPFSKKEYDTLRTTWADLAVGNSQPTASDFIAKMPGLIQNKGYVGNAMTPGNFWVNRKGVFTDPWDFELHKGQRLDNPTNILRSVASMFADPHTVTARVPSARDIVKNIPTGLLENKNVVDILDNSILNNLAKQHNIKPEALKDLGILNIDPKRKLGLAVGYMDSNKFKGLENLAKMHGFSTEDMLTLLK